jgi:hypothetical protein
MKQQLSRAGTTALAAAEDSGKAFWALFGALLLGMLSAIGGAMLGGGRGRVLRVVTPAPAGAVGGQRTEAHA